MKQILRADNTRQLQWSCVELLVSRKVHEATAWSNVASSSWVNIGAESRCVYLSIGEETLCAPVKHLSMGLDLDHVSIEVLVVLLGDIVDLVGAAVHEELDQRELTEPAADCVEACNAQGLCQGCTQPVETSLNEQVVVLLVQGLVICWMDGVLGYGILHINWDLAVSNLAILSILVGESPSL